MVRQFRLNSFARNKHCYFCGAMPPSTREHIPPKLMFNGFECDSITVPSCDEHNTEKNLKDRAVITALLLCIKAGKNLEDLPQNVISAICKLEPNIKEAKKEVDLRNFLIDPPEGLDQPLPYIEPIVNIRMWMRQLTAGLVWSITGNYEPSINWQQSIVWSPIFFPGSGPISIPEAVNKIQEWQQLEKSLDNGPWLKGWTSIPRGYPVEIYNFELGFLSTDESPNKIDVVFRHNFYNRLAWYVLFTTSDNQARTLFNVAYSLI